MASPVRWHELGQTLGDGEGQGSLMDCSPRGRKESDTTEQLTLALLFHLQLGGLCVVNPQRKTQKLYRISLFFLPPPRRNCFVLFYFSGKSVICCHRDER